jgi:hypothetical protein
MQTEQTIIEFTTVEEIINTIHLGNKDNFLTDFKTWLEVVINTVQTVKLSIELGGTDEQKEMFKDYTNADLVGCKSMKWVDDGKHNLTVTYSLKQDQ